LIARLTAYFFLGVLHTAGPVLFLIAIISSIPKAEFVCNSVVADGIVVGLQPVYFRQFSKDIYHPVVRFTDAGRRAHLFMAPNRGGLVPLKPGDSVSVLYLKGHPETARINTLGPVNAIGMAATGAGFSEF
jgi:hypothetical protein